MRKEQVVFIGNFLVGSGKLYVGDPCYARHQHNHWVTVLDNAENGVWGASVAKVDFGNWGIRNGVLMCACINDNPKVKKWTTKLGVIGVDGGAVCVFDKKHVIGRPKTKYEAWYDMVSEAYLHIKDCHFKGAGCLEHGVVSSSGLGDGVYDLKIGYDASNKVIAVPVNFARRIGEAGQTRGW